MCLIGRLEALQSAVGAALRAEAGVLRVDVSINEKKVGNARCKACEARVNGDVVGKGGATCTCDGKEGCTCVGDCLCKEEHVSVRVDGGGGALEALVPMSRADELGLPGGSYTLAVRGRGGTEVVGVRTDAEDGFGVSGGLHRSGASFRPEVTVQVGANATAVEVELATGGGSRRLTFALNFVEGASGGPEAVRCVAVRTADAVAAAASWERTAGVDRVRDGSSSQEALCQGALCEKALCGKALCGKAPLGRIDVAGELAALGRKVATARAGALAVAAASTQRSADDWTELFAPAECVLSSTLQMAPEKQLVSSQEALEALDRAVSGAVGHARTVAAARVGPADVGALLPAAEARPVARLGALRAGLVRVLAGSAGAGGLANAQGENAKTENTAMEKQSDAWTPRLWEGARVSATVDRRAHFIALAGVDAALRARAARFRGSAAAARVAERDAKVCAYQLRQVMATDAHNDVKLSAGVYAGCLSVLAEAVALAGGGGLDAFGVLDCSDVPKSSDVTGSEDGVRALRAAKALEAVGGGWPVAPGANYVYCAQAFAVGRHAEVGGGSLGFRHAGAPDVAGAAEARRVLADMADMDLRHRVISPLVHKCVRAACAGEARVPVDDVVNAFAADVRPLARLALCNEPCAAPYAFLDDASVRTGYDEEHKTRLLVQLMFGVGA